MSGKEFRRCERRRPLLLEDLAILAKNVCNDAQVREREVFEIEHAHVFQLCIIDCNYEGTARWGERPHATEEVLESVSGEALDNPLRDAHYGHVGLLSHDHDAGLIGAGECFDVIGDFRRLHRAQTRQIDDDLIKIAVRQVFGDRMGVALELVARARYVRAYAVVGSVVLVEPILGPIERAR